MLQSLEGEAPDFENTIILQEDQSLTAMWSELSDEFNYDGYQVVRQ